MIFMAQLRHYPGAGGNMWVGADSLEGDSRSNRKFWSRGYAITPDGACLTGMSLGRYLASHSGRLSTIVPYLNGCFSAFLSDGNETFVITDRFGTIPMYLGQNRAGCWSVSDDPWHVIECLPARPKINEDALIDLLHAGYVSGNNTLIDGVTTAVPSGITQLRNQLVTTERYWEYGYKPLPLSTTDAIDGLEEVFKSTIERSCRVIAEADATATLTLSGGLDSRLLAGLFSGVAGVQASALSYGDATDPEVSAAAEIARALGFCHRIVSVDKSYICEKFVEQSVAEVGITTRFTCGTGARHFKGVKDEILIPGHTGDLISGGHLPPYAGLVGNRDQLHRFLDLRHYAYPHSRKILRNVLKADPLRRFDNLSRTTENFDFTGDMFGLIDRWNVENRQRRLILMELRAYERTAPWLLPFYDYELVDYFSRIPHSLRVAQSLYIKTAIERIFVKEIEILASIRRVGKPLKVDSSAYRRIERFSNIPTVLHTTVLALWPLLRRMQKKLRNRHSEVQGPSPIQHWFRTDPGVNRFLIHKVQEISIDLVDTGRLLEYAEKDWVPGEFFHRLIPAAITAQETLDLALSHWQKAKEKAT